MRKLAILSLSLQAFQSWLHLPKYRSLKSLARDDATTYT